MKYCRNVAEVQWTYRIWDKSGKFDAKFIALCFFKRSVPFLS